jgi:cofilin
MSSGVKVSEDCVTVFNEIKLKHTKRYIIYKIENKKQIVIEKEGAKEETYDDFVKSIPKDEPRYAVVDFEYTTEDGRKQEKLVFVFWSPDEGKVMNKMLYASSKDNIKKSLSGFAKEVQANDMADLDAAEIQKKCEI